MASVNKVALLGHLGADPQSRTFQNGDKVVNFRLATSEKWRDRQSGETRERTEWHSVAVFGGAADIAERYLRKGSPVYVEGQLRTRKWQDQSGADRYTTEVVLHGPRAQIVLLEGAGGRDGGADRGRTDQGKSESGGWGAGGDPFAADLDDDIPF